MIILFGIGTALSFILLFYNRGYKTANIYLGLFLFFLSFLTFSHYLYIFSNSVSELAILLSIPINSSFYIIGPLALLYVRSILTDNMDFKKSDWKHFIPFGIIFLGRLPFNFSSWGVKVEMANKFINKSWLELPDSNFNLLLDIKTNYLLKIIHVMLYIIGIWFMIYKAKFKITTDVNEKSQILIVKRWLIILISLFTFSIICFHFIVFLFVNTPDKSKFHQEGQILFSLIFLSITVLILVLMSFPQILYGIPVGKASWIMRNEDDIEDEVEMKEANNFQKENRNISMFHEKHIENIRLKLEDWVEKGRFLREDVTLNNLSGEIGIPLHHLTYYFNQANDEKYIDWRNNLRVDYAIDLMKKEQGMNKTLETIANESGFRTYSAFRLAFKRRTGMVPKDFIKQKTP
jgi:AraC-like DNA-binding protein